jgi:hypothetical protein
MRYIRGREGWGNTRALSVDTPDGAGTAATAATAGPGPCPGCGGPGVPIVFGFPGSELIEAEARGEVILGGCCPPMDPRCPMCNGALSSGDPWGSDDPSNAWEPDGGWL